MVPASIRLKGAHGLRYRYIAYKYMQKAGPERSVQNIWESFSAWTVPATTTWRPPTDVYETLNALIVIMELAGVREEDMAVTLFSDILVVEGERPQPLSGEMSACHQLGIKYGPFRAEIYIPFPVDHDDVKAEYTNGVLRITLRKL